MLTQRKKIRLAGNQSQQFLRELSHQKFYWSKDYCLDLSAVGFVTPVVCVIAKIAEQQRWSVVEPTQDNARSYLAWSIKGHYHDPHRYISTQIVPVQRDIPRTTNDLFKIFQDWVRLSAADDLKYAVAELLDNVFDHAKSNVGPCISAQKYHNRVEVAIADMGIGIASSFKDTSEWNKRSPFDWFKYALSMKGTSKPTEHSGEGLSSVLEWLKSNSNCTAQVLSEEHIWSLDDGQSRFYQQQFPAWPGTFIWFAVPLQIETSLKTIWAELGLEIDEFDLDELF